MTRTHQYIIAGLLALIAFTGKVTAQSSLPTDSLLSLVKEAYIYGYSVEQCYRMYVTLKDDIAQGKPVYNHFAFNGKLASASPDNAPKIAAYKATRSRGGAGPNNDTPYFGTLLDLSGGPLVLSIPDFGDKRYWNYHFIDIYNQNVHYIGSSFGDKGPADYLLIGPGWKGAIPAGMKAVRFKDNHLNLVGRTLVEDDSVDIKNVVALQRQSTLTPLAQYPAQAGKYEGLQKDFPVFYNPIDSFFTNLNNALQLSPAPAQDKAELKKLAVLGIGIGKPFNWNNYDAATRQKIHNTLVETDSLLDAEGASGGLSFGNGWQRTNPLIGHWGTHYWEEALYMKHGFYAGHDETQCFYITPVSREGHGFYKGNHKYKMHFDKDSLPPLYPKGFWSLTANETPGYFLLPNPINRYAIRDRTKGLKYNTDGSLDIYIQAESPGPDKESNWLPIAKGESTTTFRVYLPKKPLLDGTYKLPPIQVVD